MQQESRGRSRGRLSSRAEATEAAAPDLAFPRDLAADPRQIVLVADNRMGYLAVSDGACRLLGYTRAELLAMEVPEVVAESDAAERYQKMISDGRQTGRITLVAKDGRRIKATYEAAEVRSGGATYYASYLTPVDGSPSCPGCSGTCAS